MANAKIEVVGPSEITLITELYGQVYKPARDVEFFRRRFLGRHNVLSLIATVEGRPVGFALGFELKPTVFFSWLLGVLPDYRRAGIASQLMEGMEHWARDHEYESIRFECHNQHRPMLHMGIKQQFDIVGIRWDPDRHANLVILEKNLTDTA